MLDAWLDLLLGCRCTCCGRPGRVLCPGCDAALVARPRVSWPTPPPPGLVLPVSAADYEGAVRELVVEHIQVMGALTHSGQSASAGSCPLQFEGPLYVGEKVTDCEVVPLTLASEKYFCIPTDR